MPTEDAEYLTERIESMLGLLGTRSGEEASQAIVDLSILRSKLDAYRAGEGMSLQDIETELYLLFEERADLGLVFLEAMETDLARYRLERLQLLAELSKQRELTVAELKEKQRHEHWLRSSHNQ